MNMTGRILLILSGICMYAASSFAGDIAGKKILFVDSYHQGYAWSDGVVNGVRRVLKDSETELRIFRMDTKRNQSEDFKRQAALKAKALIESYQPEVVIASDDNASKYLIQPHYQNVELPVVFCGLNWDASVYGYPYANATGMVEVDLIEPLVAQLRQFAKGDKIGFLAIGGTTSIKENQHHAKILGKPYDKSYHVKTYQDYKERFLKLQDEVDILILGNPQGILNWDENDFVHFAARHTRIPTGATLHWVKKFTLMGYMRIPEEQGEWAAKAALKILGGTPPSAIPMAKNQQGKLVINMRIANRLGITFDPAVFKRAEIIKPYPGKKVLYVNAYHAGYHWSDGIEQGIRNVLGGTGVELKIHFMDTKRKRSEAEKKEAALKAKQAIEAFAPDVVIASDDNSSQYLIVPYYKDADLPFVFCGVNGDSAKYGYPYRNVTGIEEIERDDILINLLRPYAKGDRKGYLTVNTATAQHQFAYIADVLNMKYDKTYLPDTYEEWKTGYLKLQEEADMIRFGNPVGVVGWDEKDFAEFALQHAKVPTIVTNAARMPFAMIGYVIFPEEHGSWAAATALRIIDGESPRDIPITQNKQGKLYLNLRFVKKLGVVIDRAVYSRAEIIK